MLGATLIQTLWRFYKRKQTMETIADTVYVKWILNPDGPEDPIMEMLACERQRLGQPCGQRRYSLREAMFKKNVTHCRACNDNPHWTQISPYHTRLSCPGVIV